MIAFFNFDVLNSVIEFNKSDRSSFVADIADDVEITCETLDRSVLAFGDRDVRGVDVCSGSTVIEYWRFSKAKQRENDCYSFNRIYV